MKQITNRDKLSKVARACRRFLDHYDAGADSLDDEETELILQWLADHANDIIAEIEDREDPE